MYFSKQIKDLIKAIHALTGKLEQLENKVVVQEREIAEVRKTLQTSLNDPVSEIVSIAGQFKKKGLIPGLLAIGTTLFRTYSKNRRGTGSSTKALPARPTEKE